MRTERALRAAAICLCLCLLLSASCGKEEGQLAPLDLLAKVQAEYESLDSFRISRSFVVRRPGKEPDRWEEEIVCVLPDKLEVRSTHNGEPHLRTVWDGRFRWSVFYPFPGTRAAEIAREASQLDETRMGSIKNFFSESALDFGEAHNLLIEKMNAAFPWFVMSETGLPAAPAYRSKVEELLKMPRAQFEKIRGDLRKMDAALSSGMVERGMEHYAIKYNEFMGVSSNYFLAEEKNQD